LSAASKLAIYTEEQQVETTASMVTRYAPMVKRIAHHLSGRLPANVQVNDLIQSGMVGLLEAAKKYDAAKGASFETFAGIRIRGAMLDDIRKEDWAPRSVHRNARSIAAAIKAVEARYGRDAQDAEVAAELNISVEEYHAQLQDSAGARLFSFDEVLESDGSGVTAPAASSSFGPLEGVEKMNFRSQLADAISHLPEREKLVLALYYKEELNLKEIGSVLGVSESRVSQIHSQAALRLRSRLADWQ